MHETMEGTGAYKLSPGWRGVSESTLCAFSAALEILFILFHRGHMPSLYLGTRRFDQSRRCQIFLETVFGGSMTLSVRYCMPAVPFAIGTLFSVLTMNLISQVPFLKSPQPTGQ